jgi:RNA recognition motif-containing protein
VSCSNYFLYWSGFADARVRLYVGKIQEGATKADTEEMLRRHFGEWGEIVKSEFPFFLLSVHVADGDIEVNILYNRGVAFLTFANEMQAQFAREAMANQSMDGDEILNVRYVLLPSSLNRNG